MKTNLSSDSDTCAQEPVQTIGHIQPHGLLFALSEPDLIVRLVSVNVSVLVGLSVDAVLGSSFENVLGHRQFSLFHSQLLSGDLLLSKPVRLFVGENPVGMNCVAHRVGGVLIVELELVPGACSLEPLDLGIHIKAPLSRMEAASDILDLSQLAAKEIRSLSGFSRVMVYRFDEHWNGEVIAEVAPPSSVPYLGLRFPASDIPAQARRLFLLNPLRTIADVSAVPVPIVSGLGQPVASSLDLTWSFLRSSAPIHLEYLRNMGVQSSLTISIIVEGHLWGMIACHHDQPRRVDCSTRSVCELLGRILSSQVALRVDNSRLQARLTSRTLLERYMSGVEESESLAAAEQFQSRHLLGLFDADGLLFRLDGVVTRQGVTVDEEALLPVIRKLRKLPVRSIGSSNMLSALDPGAASYAALASGALYLGLNEGTGDYLILTRQELVETVVWAGNPDKSVNTDVHGRLRPRASFEAWQETIRGRSRPWTELELDAASYLREQLLRLREAQRLQKAEERLRYMAHHDALTGLINRHSIHVRLEQCMTEAAATNSSFAVLFIDLDRFKSFNDRLGHAAGDYILKTTAGRMQQNVRAEDVVGRLGGDEFVIILLGRRQEKDVFQTAARILSAIEKPLDVEQNVQVNISASIGISQYPGDGVRTETLIDRSDKAMYRVKGAGGNAFEFYKTRRSA